MNMNLKSTVVCFVLHLGVLFSVTAEIIEKNVVGGECVVLHCEDDENPNPTFTWKHNKKEVLKYVNSKAYKVDKSSKYAYEVDSKPRSFPLKLLPEVEEGIYTCVTNGKEITFDLKVWKVKGSQSGYLFVGETLKLELHSSSAQHIETEWFSPQKTKVPRSEGRRKLQNNNRILEIKELQLQDHGNWECRVQSPKLSIPYDVKVIGFLNSLEPETKFAAADSSISFSCVLNINPPELPKTLIWRRMVNETITEERLLINDKSNLTEKVIHSVQAEDAGRYQCVLNFMNKELNKTVHVVVMHISRKEEALCCHISGPTLPMTQLCWTHTRMTICNPSLLEGKFCYTPETAGLWNCSLKVENDVKISMYYTLEDKEGEDHKFPWTEVTTGFGVLLLLIITGICVVTSKSFKRRRQHAMRMAQAKQHLLAKKTCQCHRELTNDYYHT